MIRLVLQIAILGAFAFGGWITGTLHPAPPWLMGQLQPQIMEARIAQAIETASANGALIAVEAVSPEEALETPELAALLGLAEASESMEAAPSEAAPLEAAPTEAGPTSTEEQVAVLPALGPPAAEATEIAASPQRSGAFETALSLCPGMTVSNAPAADRATRAVTPFAPLVNVNGVTLAVNPAPGACLSSGFGPRGSRLHRGVDYHARDGGPILAAADGVVIERVYRDDFGNMLLIDHGGGVYTRYAHLASFGRGVVTGAQVTAGQQIGLMGNTAAYPLPIHLHYEVLLGDYNNSRRSFGLETRDPFSFPAAP